MMKLSISLLLIALSISIANGASGCSGMNTKLSDTCGSITVSGVNNAYIDGKYNRIGDCLFQKIDGSDNYISEWYGSYVGNEIGDRRCERRSGSYRVKFSASELDNIAVGKAASFAPSWPSGRTVNITCDSASTEEAAPVEGLGSLCLTTSYTGDLNSEDREIKLSLLAGQYVEISGGINGKPAYELANAGSDCSAPSTLMYAKEFRQYVFVSNSDDPVNTYYFGCDNSNAIGDNDISLGCTGSLEDIVTLTEGKSCQCGRTTPAPTTPAPVTPAPVVPITTGDLCYATTEIAKNTGYGVEGAKAQGPVELSTIAGLYKLIKEADENGKPVYQLTGCGKESYIAYVDYFGLFMVVSDLNDKVNTYTTWCENTAEITDNDILQCKWTRKTSYIITNNLVSCSCGQTVPDDI